MTIPIFNLTRQYKTIKKEVNCAIQTVLSRGNFILGEEVDAFEKEFASYIGVTYAIGVASGTDALTLAIRALGLSTGDEVLLPVNSYPTFFGVAMAGVFVRFVDCDESGNISVTDLVKRITKKTKAIIVVHLYGNPADLIGIKSLLKKLHRTDIKIIEDCAQAHGAMIGSKKVGAFGDIACFSFYPSKNLGAYGDGGMILTKRKKIADHIRALRMYGEMKRYESTELSGVSRLDELHAVVLRVKLRHLDVWNKKRKKIAQLYTNVLSSIDGLTVLPYELGSCHHLFIIRTKRRDALKTYLEQHGIGCAIHYPIPLHLVWTCKAYGYHQGDFPVAEQLSKEILSLPIYPELQLSTVRSIATSIRSFYQTA
ncbi:MAG: DegT/DnrJ/EryC1/StrS family aminotransferase [Candidatus Gottesmanbacteria bacterium]